jgi:excisionase family DNA binding protein
VSNLGTLPAVKAPNQSVQRGPLARVIESNLRKRDELFSDALLPLREVRVALGVSYSQLRKLIKEGTLRTFRIGKGHIKVRTSALRELMERGDHHGQS